MVLGMPKQIDSVTMLHFHANTANILVMIFFGTFVSTGRVNVGNYSITTLVVNEGMDAALCRCRMRLGAYHSSVVHWTKNGQRVQHEDGLLQRIQPFGVKNKNLRIAYARPADSGLYKCFGHFAHGVVIGSYHLFNLSVTPRDGKANHHENHRQENCSGMLLW